MSVNFKAVPKKNPQLPAEPPKFYAHLVSTGDLTLRQLAKQIAARSTVSAADTLAVLESLLEVIPESLADGKIVRLGDFGSFSLTASSEGVVEAKDLTSNQIKKLTVKFRPGKEFSQQIDNAKIEKV